MRRGRNRCGRRSCSCKAASRLTEDKTGHLFERGAIAVVGSSSRIYSATGGAFSLGYLDAVLYDGQSLGGGLRSAKNFLLAYGQLKDKRLETVKLGGANQRSAWAFTLWGDPVVETARAADRRVRRFVGEAKVSDNTITLSVPAAAAQVVAVGRVSGGLSTQFAARGTGSNRRRRRKETDAAWHSARVALPNGPPNAKPRLRTKLSDSQLGVHLGFPPAHRLALGRPARDRRARDSLSHRLDDQRRLTDDAQSPLHGNGPGAGQLYRRDRRPARVRRAAGSPVFLRKSR